MGGSHSSRRESRVCWASRRRNEQVKLRTSGAPTETNAKEQVLQTAAEVVKHLSEQLNRREAPPSAPTLKPLKIVCEGDRYVALKDFSNAKRAWKKGDVFEVLGCKANGFVRFQPKNSDMIVGLLLDEWSTYFQKQDLVTVMSSSPKTVVPVMVDDSEEQLSTDNVARLPAAEDATTVMQTSPETVLMLDDSQEQLSTDKAARLPSAEEVASVMQTSSESDGLLNSDNIRSRSAEEELNVSHMADSCDESKNNRSSNILTQETAFRQSKDKGKGKGKDSGNGTEKVGSKSGSKGKGKGKGKSKPKGKWQTKVA